MTDGMPDSHPLLDLQGLVAGIRWHRRLWQSLALLGFVTGALLVVLFPTPPTAVARVLVIHEERASSGDMEADDMATVLALLDTAPIAAAAIQRLGIEETAPELLDSYTAVAVSNDLVELRVAASTEHDAVRRAQALADAFVADHIQRAEKLANAEAEALANRVAEAERELAALGTAGDPDPTSERGVLVARISELRRQAAAASVGAPNSEAGTQVVDPPRVQKETVPNAIMLPIVGLVLGLGCGLAAAAVATVVGDRPVLRRDIAEHLGASVIVQLPRPPRGPSRLWWRSRRVKELRRAAGTLARMVRDAPGPVSVLELGAARVAAEIVIGMVDELASDRSTLLLDDLPGEHLRVAAAHGVSGVRFADGVDFPPDSGLRDGFRECRIGVGSLEPGTAWTDLRRLGTEALLVVRAGHASASSLHTVARQLADTEIRVIGIVLVHPDPRDRSDGTLWDGLQHALRGRHRDEGALLQTPPHPPASGNGNGHAAGAPPAAGHHPAGLTPAPETSPVGVAPSTSLDAPTVTVPPAHSHDA
jgi:hypothetical protein